MQLLCAFAWQSMHGQTCPSCHSHGSMASVQFDHTLVRWCARRDDLKALQAKVLLLYSQDAMIMGADYYESDAQQAELRRQGRVPIGIGAGSTISNTIVDKNARIGENCTIVNKEGIEEANREEEARFLYMIACSLCQFNPCLRWNWAARPEPASVC